MARDEQGVADFIEQSASALAAAGFPRMPARVLMALTAAESGGLTAGELGEQLGVSAAGISGAVRYLQTVRMVRRVAQPGSRRALYVLPEHAWYAATLAGNPTYDQIEALARKAIVAIDDPDSLASQRIQEMHDFFLFVQTRMPTLLEEWEAERAAAGDVGSGETKASA
jgi:DNA-binding transcriptional regulator GbsR (MarR family)